MIAQVVQTSRSPFVCIALVYTKAMQMSIYFLDFVYAKLEKPYKS
ncbi:hypothetical protein COO91_09269 (plasmid) [Nostoc flagelliforme CCNUN1]|uniref:Uncharacterized protein n=1 Tax=Nostoc flagelliforme CCNUN1 TaxID=2038116 RepID=A0A2K8T617_9NOSO|nr:hypothetical protein COO91_09269 [Nostoc flagelliforme CCNUN1]